VVLVVVCRFYLVIMLVNVLLLIELWYLFGFMMLLMCELLFGVV